jgi:hypothetical protein
MKTSCSISSMILNATTTWTLPFFIWNHIRLREVTASVPSANRSRHVRTRSQDTTSLDTRSYWRHNNSSDTFRRLHIPGIYIGASYPFLNHMFKLSINLPVELILSTFGWKSVLISYHFRVCLLLNGFSIIPADRSNCLGTYKHLFVCCSYVM